MLPLRIDTSEAATLLLWDRWSAALSLFRARFFPRLSGIGVSKAPPSDGSLPSLPVKKSRAGDREARSEFRLIVGLSDAAANPVYCGSCPWAVVDETALLVEPFFSIVSHSLAPLRPCG